MSNTSILYIIIFGSMVGFGGVGVYALYWAAKNGQMNNLEKGSEVIFDRDEKIGKETDVFPAAKVKKS